MTTSNIERYRCVVIGAADTSEVLSRDSEAAIDRLTTLWLVLMGIVYRATVGNMTARKEACQWGRKLLLPAPQRACLPVCQRALAVPERAPEETVRA